MDATRAFFAERNVLEVDTPILQGGANLDRGVIPFAVEIGDAKRFLPTSPEHPLKRLVAAGSGPIWTLAPAFRRGENGRKHSPEFRMLEWYRPGWDDRQLCAEVIELLCALTGKSERRETLTYAEAFERHAGIDPFISTDDDLNRVLGADARAAMGDRAAALDLILATRLEPHFGREQWTVITDYPPWAAAQARLRMDARGREVAARFEIYRDGIELANGYDELTHHEQLRERLSQECAQRGNDQAMRDIRFEAAMAAGLPPCAGVAVGFDRVVMIALGIDDIGKTQGFAANIS